MGTIDPDDPVDRIAAIAENYAQPHLQWYLSHKLLPRVSGTLVVQDIVHFDPRPEWATEAYYLLTHLQLTGEQEWVIGAVRSLLDRAASTANL